MKKLLLIAFNLLVTLGLMAQSITVTSPNGGENFAQGSSQNITWTSSGAGTEVNIFYSTDGGSNYSLAAAFQSNDGSYTWTVPSVTSSNCLVKVVDFYTSATFDESDAVFTIETPKTITVTYPNGGESLTPGASTSIQWTSTGAISEVELYYSTDGGTSWIFINDFVSNTGSYSWTVPNENSSQCLVQVMENMNSSISDNSNSNFTIYAPMTITMLYPENGEVITAGSTINMLWSTTGSITSVDLYYSTDGQSSWVMFATNVTNDGSYPWTTPNVNSTNCYIAAVEYSGQTIYDIGNGAFTLTDGASSVQVTYPNGGESLSAGNGVYVTWTSANITYLEMYYSTDGGSNWIFEADGIDASSGSYYWTTPNITSSNCLVRLVDMGSAASDESNAVFSINPSSIILTSPNGGESWESGTYHYITWSGSLGFQYVALYYSIDGGSNWTYFAWEYSSNGSYNWQVPNYVGCNVMVKVADYYNSSTVFDISDASFCITAGTPSLTLTTPNGGDNWATNVGQYIYWNALNITNVQLEYSTDGGTNWIFIADNITASSGYYYWNPVPNTPSSNCYVRVSDMASSTTDVSNTAFTLYTPSITLGAPNGGEAWEAGSYQYINWSGTYPSSYVNLYYSVDGGSSWITIATAVYVYNESYQWFVPTNISCNALVKIQDYYTSSFYDESDATFCIEQGPPSVVVSTPNGGDSWATASNQYIYWSAGNMSTVQIEYTTDGGSNWILIADNVTASNGYYYWTVPNTPSTNCYVRVTDEASSTSDMSNSAFTIYTPYYSLNAPDGGESWMAGSTQSITWTGVFPSSYVNLYYSVDNGVNWTYINYAYVYNYTYSWVVPNNVTCNALVKIEDYYTGLYPDSSASTFCITEPLPAITVTTPNGGDNFAGGSNSYIYWSSANISTVTIEYSLDGGTSWTTITTSATASNGYYLWSVPNTASNNALIRVTDNATSTSDVSDAVFNITSSYYTLTSPDGGESWEYGSYHNITWTGAFPSSYVNIYYSVDGGTSWNTIATAAYSYNYYYSWYVPTYITCDALIKIEDYYYASISDVSNATFCIAEPVPSLEVTTPNGGDYWQTGTGNYIYWNSSMVSTVQIEYSTDGGANWIFIADNITASNGYYYWSVPNTVSTNCLVKITDMSSSLNDVSDAVFTIYSPYISLTTPDGGENWEAGTYQYIYWTGVYPSSYVSLYYSIDGGLNWSYISWVYASNGSYQWYVPNNVGCNVLIKIEDYYDNSYVDVSSSSFCITPGVPALTFTYPNGGESLATNSGYYIYWNSANISTLTLEYSIDGGSTWILIDDNVTADNEYYYWTTPSTASSNCLVRVTDNASSTTDQSDSVFSISAPYVTVTTPNGGQLYTGGDVEYIYWNSAIPNNYVNIYYSTDGGTNWTTITSAYYNYGYYAWTVPNIAACSVLVKVEDYYNSTTFDASDATFCIEKAAPTISVTTPNGFDTWVVGSGKYIYWYSISVDNVKIELSIDGGSSWSTITSSVAASTGSYYLVVPNTPSGTCRVKITDLTNTSINDMSDYDFSIVSPSITVTSPNGGESYTAGNEYYIYWDAYSTSNYVNILYSTDGGASWDVIANGAYNYEYYYWSVPNTPSTNCLIKIEDYYSGSIIDVSDNEFTILEAAPSVYVDYPNGGETFAIGSTQTIYWNATSIDNVKIEYSIDGGSTFNTIVANYSASVGYYSWTVPNSPSVYCYIRISDASNSSVYDWSNNAFSIVNPSIVVTSPNGGESYTGLNGTYIYWNSTGASSYVRIDFSTNNGLTWSTVSSYAYNYGYYYWTVPNVSSSNCLIKVTDYSNNQIKDVSNSTFTINQAAVTLVLTEPNGGEVFGQGVNTYISWNSSQVSAVNIYYSNDGGSNWSTVASNVTSNGYYSWTTPADYSSYCLIKIEDASNASLYDVSNAYFTIQTPYFYVYTPNGGETYTVGDYQTVTWTSTAASSYVKIEISVDGGATYTTLANSTYNDGSYGYYVPNTPSNNCFVKVSDYSNTLYGDDSNSAFSIVQAAPSLALTYPNGGQTFATGTSANITWTSNSVANVKLQYSTDGGLTWIVITSSTPSDGSYSWTIPSTTSTECLINISDASGGGLSDQSTGYFTIASPSLVVSTPNGGESYQVGTNKYITWTSLGAQYVTISYSTDGGATYSIIVTNLSNTGYYNWSVPNTISSTCLVKVKSVALTPAIEDVSDAVFSIVAPTPVITLTSPNGGEVWYTGYNYYIGWSSTAISNVKLEYSTDGGTDWTVISNSHPAAGGFFYWNVPNDPSTTCRVRVSDASNASVTDISNYNFTIAEPTPSVQVTYPNGGETLYQGSYKYVTWTRNFVNEVNAYYSIDNGSSWNTLATNLNSNYFYWNVPVVSSTNCLIRVEQFGNASVADQSDAVFTIEAPFVNTNTLAVDTIMSIPFCKEDTIEVAYIATGTFNTGNMFTVQLSDSLGSFAYPISIGSLESVDLVDTITCVVPASVGNGDGYRIRVVADDYTIVGSDNGEDILISSPEFDFVADEVIKYIPNSEVDFTYIGETADIDSLAWDFGDNGTSDALNPSHTYGDIGFYDVKLTVIDNNGCAITENKASYMRIERLFLSTPLTTNTSYNVTGLAFSNSNIGLGCISLEDGNCLITSDSGNTWVPSVTGVAGMLSGAAIVPGAWFVTGQNGQINSTANQGATWTTHYTGTNENFNASAFTSATNGFAVGTNGTVYHYDGSNWASQSSGVSSHLNSVAATGSTAFAVGNGGAMTYYNGSAWSTLTSGTSADLTGIFMYDANKGYVVGTGGTILSWNGTAWSVSLSGLDIDFTSVAINGTDTAWAAGTSGIIYRTYDGGNTWARYSIGSTNKNNGIVYKRSLVASNKAAAAAANRGYVVGNSGDARRFDSGDPTTNSEVAVKSTEAAIMNFRAYPNPTTDYVVFETVLQHEEKLVISIKNMEGKEVMKVNNSSHKGPYSKTVSVAGLANGVYFVHVNQGANSWVQKLVVTK